jgi:mannose-6-phosphate isomerase-like protein (cupin superfamily)
MKFSLDKARKFGWKGLKGWAYNSKEDFENASAAYFELTGSHGEVKTTLSDRVYFVVEGEGEFEIDGEKISVEKEEVVVVPKNTPYDYRAKGGVLKLFLVHVPAFDPEYEVKLE